MGYGKPVFPDEIWDGSSKTRPELSDDRSADYEDYDQITAEVIAVQQYIVADSDKYEADCSAFSKGLLVRLLPDGSLVPASSTFFEVAGMVISKINYARRGRVYSEDWTNVAGSVELEIGKTYFLRQFGQMRLEPPTIGYITPVGQAQTSRTFDFNIGTTVQL